MSPIFVCIRYLHLPVRSNLYLMYFVFHDTWSESLTTLSESQYLYQEDYHSMVQCAALNCTIKSGHGISMYLFPKDAKLRKIWTVRLKTDGFQPSQYTKLCERHFEKEQFAVNPDLGVPIKSKHIWFREQYHPFMITQTRKLNLADMEKGCQRVPYQCTKYLKENS